MYKNILVPTDGSDFSMIAVRHAIKLAKFHGSKITGITVVTGLSEHVALEGHTLEDVQTDFKALSEEHGRQALKPLVEAALEEGLEPELHYFKNVSPHEGIILAAKNHKCDLIVMATHARRGVSALLLGNEAQKVIAQSPVPVLVVR
ncbi:MAG TPA: universal stress protein [Hyphomicrobiaceae bacterium]|nr:universal stress protein [Hyphomicrobiaceae bacterium]